MDSEGVSDPKPPLPLGPIQPAMRKQDWDPGFRAPATSADPARNSSPALEPHHSGDRTGGEARGGGQRPGRWVPGPRCQLMGQAPSWPHVPTRCQEQTWRGCTHRGDVAVVPWHAILPVLAASVSRACGRGAVCTCESSVHVCGGALLLHSATPLDERQIPPDTPQHPRAVGRPASPRRLAGANTGVVGVSEESSDFWGPSFSPRTHGSPLTVTCVPVAAQRALPTSRTQGGCVSFGLGQHS